MAAQDLSANINYPMAQNGSTDKFSLTIEQFNGTVHDIIQKMSILDGVFDFRPLIGTDTMSNNQLADPVLQAVVAGVEPLGQSIAAGKMIVQVKTPIIARTSTAMLADVQEHLNTRGRTPGKFAKRISKHLDEVLFVQIVKSILWDQANAPSGGTNTAEGSGGILPVGSTVELAAGDDETDAAKLTTAIYSIVQALAEKDIDQNDGMLYMSPAQYFTLLKNQDLLDKDINKENGSYAHASVTAAAGLPVVMTNRLQQADDTVASPAYTDSPAALYGYESENEESDAVAVYCTEDTIMVAQSIPLTTDVYWDQRLLTWFIDAYMAIGAAPDRTDVGAGVFKYSA